MPRRCTKRSHGKPDPEVTIKPQRGRRPLARRGDVRRPAARTRRSRACRSSIACIELYSRDAGRREAKLLFDVGQGTQDLGFRNEVNILFNCEPAVAVIAGRPRRRRPADHRPRSSSATRKGRVYPSQSRRLAPDFFFHPQIYRHSGETRAAAAGQVPGRLTAAGRSIACCTSEITVPDSVSHKETFRLQALDQAGRPRLVLGRSSRPRRRLRPLRVPDRGRAARRHDAAHPGRGPERRLRAVAGARAGTPRSSTSRARSTRSRRPAT